MSDKKNDGVSLPTLLTVIQVAGHLQCSTKQVRRWIKSGALRAVQLGRHLRIAENDLAHFLMTPKGRGPGPLLST